MKLRQSWILLLLGGMLVLLGGSASSSSAGTCNDVTHFTVVLTLAQLDATEANDSFTATVTALGDCGPEAVTSYKGPATLNASGTLADGTFVSSGAAGIGSDIKLNFKQGIATPTVTATADALGVALKVTDDANASITGSSPLFNVYDVIDPCTSNDCSGALGAQAGTTVSVDIPDDGVSGFLGLSLSPHILSASECDLGDGPQAMGAMYTIAPPTGLAADATYTATVRYTKKVAPGTGVSNFVLCMATPTVVGGQVTLDYQRILPCDNQVPDPKCILSQKRTGVGDLVVVFLLGANDPGGAGFT